MHQKLDCGDVTRRLAEYLDDALPPDQRQGVEEHLAACEACRTTLRELRATIDLLGRLPPEPTPPDLKSRLRDRLRARKRPD
jgi:anti-sigma factor (TIGR02949 family)